jgi:hypothetical protein
MHVSFITDWWGRRSSDS